jgi:hypothetical protein
MTGDEASMESAISFFASPASLSSRDPFLTRMLAD